MLLFRLSSLYSIILALSLTAASQTANLSGMVRDSSGAVVAGAKVTVAKENTGVNRATSSGNHGIYYLSFLLPGFYTVTVEASGFQIVSRSDLKLDPGQEARLDFTLSPAAVKESITVQGSVSSLQTESPAVSTEIDSQLVQDLPLNGRTFQSLLTLAPGVVRPGTLNQTDPQGGTFVNGQRAPTNYFSVDGVSANVAGDGGTGFVSTVLGTTHNLLSVDDMQEFKVQTSTYSAEFGRGIGAQVSVISRSGTNQFHGSVFDYFRNEAMDANDWFSNAQGLPRAVHRQNDFGSTFAGPLWQNKTFFFFSYEGLRLQQPVPFQKQVPSLNARSAATGAIQQLLNAFPLPTGPEDSATLLAPVVGDASFWTSSNNTSIRVDHELNEKVTMFGRYSEGPSNTIVTGLFGFSLIPTANFRSATLGTTVLLSPKTTTDVRMNYSRSETGQSFGPDRTRGAAPPPDSLIFPPPFSSRSSSLFVVFGLGEPFWQGRQSTNLQRQGNIVSNTSMLRGPHELRFGVDYRYLAPHSGPANYRQTVHFAGVAGALTGLAQAVGITSANPLTLGFHELALYGQDSWKATPRFTLVYGLRWELSPPPHSQGNEQLLTLTGFPDIANLQLAPLGTPIYKTTYDNFAPRIGAAYQLAQHPGRETLIRGGFGIYYQPGVGYIASAATLPQPGAKAVFNVPLPLSSQAVAPAPPLAFTPPYDANFNIFTPNYQLPRSYQWNVTVDQRFGSNQVFSASYVGEAGRSLLRQIALFGPTAQFPDEINVLTNQSSSDYHALQLQFQRRMTRGLSTLLSYTWSHSIDDTSDDEGFDNITNPRIDRGASAFDVRQAFNAAFTYDIPSVGEDRALRTILSGWSTDTILTARTALPVNVYVDIFDVVLESDLLQARPDRVPGVPLYIRGAFPGGRRVNPAAFSAQSDLRQGNLERNLVRGFPIVQWDFDFRRQFSISDRLKLQWRADFFNLLNHPVFGLVDGQLGTFGVPFQANPTFGLAELTLAQSELAGSGDVTPLYSVGGARSIQLSLRLRF